MTHAPEPDWAATRSETWRRQIAGLEAMLAPVDEPLIAALALESPARIVDVGCGGGATTLAALRRAPSGSIAHGVDLSPVLVAIARQRIGRDADSIAFDVADMGVATPPDRPFDRMVSRLGVMFFADPPSAFGNLRRWLAPRGRVALAVWGPLDENVWMTATRDAVAHAIRLAPIDPAAPGPFRYGDVAPLLALLRGAGFRDVAATPWRQALPIGQGLRAPDAARFALAAFSRFAEQLAEAGGDAAATACRALAARFAAFERGGIVTVPGSVHIVTGRASDGTTGGRR